MRIALAAWSRRRAGGVETYVEHVLGALAAAGHDLALWSEVDEPRAAAPIALPPGTSEARLPSEIDRALAWRPDAIVVNGLQDVAVERQLLEAGPSLFVAHNFYGTCISGTKSWSAPRPRPCARRFGPGCLVHYFPHRCGGLNPVTMLSLYGNERTRLAALDSARRIVTLSSFMRAEYLRHGFASDRVVCVPYGPGLDAAAPVSGGRADLPSRLIFVGRLERLKGVHVLLDAAQSASAALDRSLTLTIVGDGPERESLERRARASGDADSVKITFAGRLSPAERDARLANADLLVVPSLWPEPLGLVGFEAGRLGVPAVAFDVGGIRQWLTAGVNGWLVPGDPPTAAALGAALAGALRDRAVLSRMSAGAVQAALNAPTPASHVEGLVSLLEPARTGDALRS